MSAATAVTSLAMPAPRPLNGVALSRSNAMVLAHLDVADAIARRFAGAQRDTDDLRQVAYMGLVKASRRFDPNKGDDFVSFAVPTISGELKRHLRDHGWVVRPPRRVQELRLRIAKARDDLAQKLHREPSAADLAASLHTSRADVREAIESGNSMRPTSLDASVRDGGDSLGSLVADEGRALERAELQSMLAPAVKRLAPREKHILYLRFYRELTQQEIAQTVGVTQMHVSRLLSRILDELRAALTEGREVIPIRPVEHVDRAQRRTA